MPFLGGYEKYFHEKGDFLVMARETENKNIYKLQENTKFGEVRIADDVISMIAAISATEV